ncbi:MAG TPA: Uma2 family endonuclease [Candidatus Limnocylindrales bacterium]|nr:Uma2 family endonuclease [Candidatus Limnocylindrales bacterium]
MEERHNAGVTLEEVEIPPTEDELPYSDGIPMESERHVLQMYLLILPLRQFWRDREFFVGGNMFIYFSLKQLRHQDFRGPDVFVVLDVPKRERKSWVVWQEGKGPDVVIELLSESTAGIDKGEKKRVYQDQLKVTEYFWYDPFTGELAGFQLQGGIYVPIEPDVEGGLVSKRLGLKLVKWAGKYAGVDAVWLRWATREGELLPTEEELAEQERQRAEQERQRAEQEKRRAEQAEQLARQQKQRADELEALLARYRERFGEVPE